MLHNYFRITCRHDTDLDYAASTSITLRDDDVQDFATRLNEILLFVTKIPPDDALGQSVQIENT